MRRRPKPDETRKPIRHEPVLLGQVLSTVGPSAAERARGVNATVWRQAVGHRIANRTTPTRLSRGTLSVNVASAAWAQELGLLGDEIVVRLQAFGLDVHKVRFQVGRPNIEPSTERALVKPAAVPQRLLQHASQIEDADLKNAILEAAALWSGRLKGRATRANR